MEELGIIINQNGEYMSFGKWVPRNLRSYENDNDWHNESFIKYVYNTEWFQNLGIPYDLKKNFHNQLDVFAKSGIVVIANNKESNKGSFVLVSPNTITYEQIQVLLSKKEDFIHFEDNNYSFIDVFNTDEEYSIIESFNHISDYYNYLKKILVSMEEKQK